MFLEGITVNAAKIARSLVVPMLIPLAVGLLLRAYRPGAARRIRPTAGWISNISMILVVVLTTAGDFKSVLWVFGTFGPWPPSRTRWSASESDGSLEDPERAPGGRSKPILRAMGNGGYCTRFSDRPWSVVRCDDGASLDFAVVEELVGLGCAVQREVFDEHLDLFPVWARSMTSISSGMEPQNGEATEHSCGGLKKLTGSAAVPTPTMVT